MANKPTKPKKPPKGGQQASQKGPPNTAKYPYLDTFSTSSLCGPDKTSIEKACKDEEGKKASKDAKNKAKPKSKLGAVTDKVKKAAGALDEAAKKAYGYGDKEKADPATSWMDDHCDGLWVKPNATGAMDDFAKQLNTVKEQLNKDIADTVQKAGGKMVDMAGDAAKGYAEKAVIREGVGVASLVVPVVGEVILAGVTVWNIADGIWTAGKTAVNLVGSAKDAYDKISGLKDQLGKIDDLLSGKMSKTEIFEETMTALAELSPCLRARKCQLVPYNKTGAKSQAQKGDGCCPGQTGHHIIPDSAASGAGCEKYTKGSAPVVCLEGASNTHGSHGAAHQTLKGAMEKYNGGPGEPPKDIPYEKMRDESLNAIKHATSPQCNPLCLQAQMDSYYKKCGPLKANPGTGGGTAKSDTETDTE